MGLLLWPFKALGSWLGKLLLGWVISLAQKAVSNYLTRKRTADKRADENKQAEKKLEEAKSEEEVISAGSDLLSR